MHFTYGSLIYPVLSNPIQPNHCQPTEFVLFLFMLPNHYCYGHHYYEEERVIKRPKMDRSLPIPPLFHSSDLITHIVPRLNLRPVRPRGDLHRHGDRAGEYLSDVCCFGGFGFRLGPGLDDRDEDAAFPVAAVEFWCFCCSVLDEAAPVVCK